MINRVGDRVSNRVGDILGSGAFVKLNANGPMSPRKAQGGASKQ